MRISWPLLVVTYLLLSIPVQATEGALPHGKSEAPGKKLILPPVENRAADCGSYMSNPESGEIFFSGNGRQLYFLSPEEASQKAGSKSILFEVDLTSLRVKKIIALKTGPSSALIGYGQPVEFVTVLDLANGQRNCGEGQSAGVSIRWGGKQKNIKSFPVGQYKVVPSENGLQLADLDQHVVRALDPTSFQKRTLSTYAPKLLPLYFRQTPPSLYAFSVENNELQRFDVNEAVPRAVLKLKKGMKLIQSGSLFAILSASEDKKTLEIKQIKAWSGDAFRAVDLQLPEPWTSDKVAVALDFAAGTAAVYGASVEMRKELPQVLIYNLAKGSLERTLKAGEGEYFSRVLYAPQGEKIFALSRDRDSNQVRTLRIGDLEKGEWREIGLAQDLKGGEPKN